MLVQESEYERSSLYSRLVSWRMLICVQADVLPGFNMMSPDPTSVKSFPSVEVENLFNMQQLQSFICTCSLMSLQNMKTRK